MSGKFLNVALFGGSFDPPHVGHVLGAAYALATGGFDRILVVPVFAHAFDKPLSPFRDRVEMTRRAFANLRHCEVSTVEEGLGAPSRTQRTVDLLRSSNPGWKLRLVVGTDVLAESHKWQGFDDIVQKAPLYVLGRAGVFHEGGPPSVLPEVSSTQVRERFRAIAGSRRVDDPVLSRLVPRAVLEYADAHGLYP